MRNKHILAPLDLLRGAASALVAVQQMAAETPVSITLLHVIDLNIFPSQPAIDDQLCAESQAALRKLAKLFFGAEQAARTIVRLGRPAEEIIAEAKTTEADLIVMCGPKSGRRRLLRYGTTQRVLRCASCPALVLGQCTDGLYSVVLDDEICEVAGHLAPEQGCAELIARAEKRRGGRQYFSANL